MNKKILLIFFLAFLIRLIAINQSLWLDEGTTAKVVKEYEFTRIVSEFTRNDFHPPLYYLFMKLWTSGFGYSEIALRMPSVIFSLLTGWIIYLIGKKIDNDSGQARMTGTWSAIFFLFNPLIIYYSQEARMYSMTTFLLICGFYLLIKELQTQNLNVKSQSFDKAQDDPEQCRTGQNYNSKVKIKELKNNDSGRALLTRMTIVLPGVFFSLAFLTFYGSIFFIAAILIWLLIKKKYKMLLVISYWLFGTLIILAPILFVQLQNAKSSLQLVTNWSVVLGKANIKNLILIPIKFTSGRISFEPKWVYYLISGLWLMVTSYFIIQSQMSNVKSQNDNSKFKSNHFFLYLMVSPLFLGFITSFFTPLLQYFRFLYLIVPMNLLLAIGTNKNWQRYLLAGGFIVFSLVYLLNPQFHREDWKSLAQNISPNTIVYAIPSSMDGLYYYRPDLESKIYDLKNIHSNDLEYWNDIVVIPYTSEIYGINYKKNLERAAFFLKQTKVFRGLSIEEWTRNLQKR